MLPPNGSISDYESALLLGDLNGNFEWDFSDVLSLLTMHQRTKYWQYGVNVATTTASSENVGTSPGYIEPMTPFEESFVTVQVPWCHQVL
jgi:hypothetical protein